MCKGLAWLYNLGVLAYGTAFVLHAYLTLLQEAASWWTAQVVGSF